MIDEQGISLTTRILFWLYRLLLKTYPARFRQKYALPMQQLLVDIWREAERRGRASVMAKVWGITFLDLILTIPAEYLDDLRLSHNLRGPALMLGGALFSTGFLLPNPDPAAAPLGLAGPCCLALSCLFLTIGLFGFQASYADRLGIAGRVFLALAALGSIVSMVGSLEMMITGLDLLWGVRMLGFVILFLFMTLCGLVCLVRRPLPHLNGIPLLIGVWIPAGGLFGALYHATTGNWLGGGSLAATGIILTIGVGFLLLGNMLRIDPAAPPSTEKAS
jgi:hypothetical protein